MNGIIDEHEPEKGELVIIYPYEIHCGKCHYSEAGEIVADDPMQVIRRLKENAWKRSHEDGWICPTCNIIEAL